MEKKSALIFFFFISLACRTSDLIATGAGDPNSAAVAPTVRPTFTPAPSPQPSPRATATRTRTPAPRAPTAPPTAIPQPTLPPAPPPPPVASGAYFKVSKSSCAEGGNTRVIGTVYDAGNKVSGLIVRVSAVPGGPPAINDSITGVDPKDPRRADSSLQGQYLLALYEGQQKKGNWFVFIITQAGDILSDVGNIQTSDGRGCNIGTVDFSH
ncbi:MAG: hypothetical protein HY327_01510 [Chloroflexi bacterium]|nr:hypothetical protein [Chloroflexota bacterium]